MKELYKIVTVAFFLAIAVLFFSGKEVRADYDYSDVTVKDDNVFVYYLYNPYANQVLYTSDENEATVLFNSMQWTIVYGRGWYAPSKGTPVFRLRNSQGHHLYTSSENELKVLAEERGWEVDNNGKPIFYSGGNYTIYRLFNTITGEHMYTPNLAEYNGKAGKDGWVKDETTFKAVYSYTNLNNPLDYIVPMEKLQNLKSIKERCTDAELREAYNKSLLYVLEFVYMTPEEQMNYIAGSLRQMVENGSVRYSESEKHYSDPYGYMVKGVSSCAGCTRTTGMWLNMLGYSYEHVNENKWSHQWCRVKMKDGSYWITDAYGMYVGKEPEPYKHPLTM